MSDFDLTQLKLKTSEDLNQDEKDFIIQHQDQLNDEDKDAYSDFLPREIETNTSIPEDKPSEDEKPVETEPDAPVFKSQEDVDRYINEKLAEREAKLKEELAAATESQEKPEEPVFFQGDEKPTDWNDALGRAVKVAKEEAVREFQKMTEAEKEAARARQKQLDEANEQIQKDFEKLVKDNAIPALDSEEGKQAQQKIMQFGIKHRKPVLDAYDLLKDIPEDRGGFLAIESTPQNDAKSRLDAQKKAAGKVGGGNKGGTADTKPKLSSEEYSRMDVQDIIEWGLEHR